MTTIANHIKAKNSKGKKNPVMETLLKGHDERQVANKEELPKRVGAPARFPTSKLLEDGVDHINLWSRGKTELGRSLAFDAPINVTLEGFGEFGSPFALWTFLTTKERHESLRFANPPALRQWIARRAAEDNVVQFLNIEYICAMYVAEAILYDSAITKSLVATGTAPIQCYVDPRSINRGGVPHSDRWTPAWWVTAISLIRDCLVTGKDVYSALMKKFAVRGVRYSDIFKAPSETKQARLGAVDRSPQKEEVAVVQEPQPAKKKSRRPKKRKAQEGSTGYIGESHADMIARVQEEDLKVMRETTLLVYYSPTAEARRELMAFLAMSKPEEAQSIYQETARDLTWKYPTYVYYSKYTGEIVVISTSTFNIAVDPFDAFDVPVNEGDDLLQVFRSVMGVTIPMELSDFHARTVRQKPTLETTAATEDSVDGQTEA